MNWKGRIKFLLKNNILVDISNSIKVKEKQKIFCVGRNKTGTTSLARAFYDLGFIVGNQRKAENLYDNDYFEGNFKRIINYCKNAQVFQDVPFSVPETYKHLDRAYPGSKFILTVRDSPEKWYNSLINFHAKLFGKNGEIPTFNDLKQAKYVREGFMLNLIKLHGTSKEDPYNKKIMIEHYKKHNQDIIEYFKNRPNDLLILNLKEEKAYSKFLNFIGVDYSPYKTFPWENKTSNIKK